MKIAIAGYGAEGQASYRYWSGRADVVIADERLDFEAPVDTETIRGPEAFSKLADYDLIIRSPGVSPQKLPYVGKVWSASNEFFSVCEKKQVPIVGVTGTKGKGTTSSLIASMLRAAGQTVHLVGNIGKPALDTIDNISQGDVVVYELSSFQLWDLERSPQVAVVLPVEPDHLDVHADFEDYLSAKANIAKSQKPEDVIIYNKNNNHASAIASSSVAETRLEYPVDIGKLAESVRLPGEHNQENASAAILAARQFVSDEVALAHGLQAFKGLEHRLKLIAEIDTVRYFDDSISTTPGSAIAAIKAFKEPKIIILGGSNKGVEYEEIIDLAQVSETRVVAMGQTGKTIEALCAQRNVDCRYVESMSEAVSAARSLAGPGSVVLLSPASASFDQYKNYAQRGDEFIREVMQLAG